MRISCVKCGCRFDISNREVLAMADKLRAKKAGEANGNLRTDPPAHDVESIALRFRADNQGGGRGEPTEDDLDG